MKFIKDFIMLLKLKKLLLGKTRGKTDLVESPYKIKELLMVNALKLIENSLDSIEKERANRLKADLLERVKNNKIHLVHQDGETLWGKDII